MIVTVESPSTLYFKATDSPVKAVRVIMPDGLVYYERSWSMPVYSFKFNIPDRGNYKVVTTSPVKLAYLVPLEKSSKVIKLPPPERYYKGDMKYKVITNPMLIHTPAWVDRNKVPIYIEVSYAFKKLPFYAQRFIILHELGHVFYKKEHFADLYAMKKMLDHGYNESSNILALKNVLHRSAFNLSRVKNLIGNITS